jgi:hypothetical protein
MNVFISKKCWLKETKAFHVHCFSWHNFQPIRHYLLLAFWVIIILTFLRDTNTGLQIFFSIESKEIDILGYQLLCIITYKKGHALFLTYIIIMNMKVF